MSEKHSLTAPRNALCDIIVREQRLIEREMKMIDEAVQVLEWVRENHRQRCQAQNIEPSNLASNMKNRAFG